MILKILVIREMQVKTTKYHFTPTRIAIIKKKTLKISVTEIEKKLEPSYIAGGHVNAAATEENSLVVPQ